LKLQLNVTAISGTTHFRHTSNKTRIETLHRACAFKG